MPLMRNGSTLLRASSGELAGSLACCCGNEDCPPCCARIVTGALIEGVIHLFVAGDPRSLEGEIVTDSGTKIVCDGDEITITWRVDPENAEVSPGAYANWDPNWKYIGHSPAESMADGSHEPIGFVEWGDVTDQEYSLTLQYSPCLIRENPELGAIEIGFRTYGLQEIVVVESCPNSNDCCFDEPECAPCCYVLLDGVLFEGKFIYYFDISPSLYGILRVDPDPDTRRICYPEEGSGETTSMTIELEIGQRGPQATIDLDVEIETGFFKFSSATPAADEEPPVGEPGVVKWFDSSATIYRVEVYLDCPDVPGTANGVKVTVADNIANTTGVQGADFGIGVCEDEFDCDCCCPKWCFRGCYFPVSDDAADQCQANSEAVPPITVFDDPSPLVAITGFSLLFEASDDVYLYGFDEEDNPLYCNTREVRQSGASIHRVVCALNCRGKWCPRHAGQFLVPMEVYLCGDVFNGNAGNVPVYRINADPEAHGEEDYVWNAEITGWGPFIGGEIPDDYEYSGDCTTVSISYTYVEAGVTYTVTGTFDVTGPVEACDVSPDEEGPY